MMEVQMAQVEQEAMQLTGDHQQMMMQHQQMLYQQMNQEQQTYMMQMNDLQYALSNAPQGEAAVDEETEMEKELEKFTNGAGEKSKAKIAKIEKLFERPEDGPEVVYL